MYCRACGNRVTEGDTFCSRCGAAQTHADDIRMGVEVGQRRDTPIPFGLAVALMILAAPLTPLWVWLGTTWSTDTKFAVSGLAAPQLWVYFLWKQRWPLAIRALSVVLFLLLMVGVLFRLEGPVGGEIAAVLTIPLAAVAMGWRPFGERSPEGGSARERVGAKLELCHDLIAEIEVSPAARALPCSAAEWQAYRRGLDLQSEGARMWETADSDEELVRADRALTRALHDLRATRDMVKAP